MIRWVRVEQMPALGERHVTGRTLSSGTLPALRRLDLLLVQGETRVFQNRDGIIIGRHQPHFYSPPGEMREWSLFAQSRIERIGIVFVREYLAQGDLGHTVQLPF